MDYSQLEMESNQPQQNRDRSRRCGSKLSDALAYAESVPELPEPVDGSLDQETSDMLLPEQVASVRGSPDLTASVRDRSRRCGSRLSHALAYAESLPELPGPVEGPREHETLDKLLAEQVASVRVPQEMAASVRESPDLTASVRESPDLTVSVTVSPELAASVRGSPDLTASVTASPELTVSVRGSRSRRCGSKLSDALAYAESVPGLPEPVDGSSEQETVDKLSPEQVASVKVSPQLTASVRMSPELTASVKASPEQAASVRVSPSSCKRAVSDCTLSVDKTDHKRNLSRASSETATINLPTTSRFDIGNALSSPEPSLFTTAYQIQASPPPFTAWPLSSIKGLQQDNESQLQQLDADKQFEIRTEVTYAEAKLWDEVEKLQDIIKTQEEEGQESGKEVEELQMEVLDKDQGKVNDLKDGALEAAEKFLFIEPDQEETDYTDFQYPDVTETLTTVRERLIYLQRKGKLPQQATKVSKPPPRSKESIVVRETKASRLRKNKLLMQNEQPDMVQNVLPPVKIPVKHSSQSIMAQNYERRSQLAPIPKAQKPSLNDYVRRKSIPPPLVRETKAYKLRCLKKIEDEKKSQAKREQERKEEFTFVQREKAPFQRKRSPTPTFKPAPPKPYKKPGPVVIKETRASILRKA